MQIGKRYEIINKMDVTEVYSPPSVAQAAQEVQLCLGEAMELTTGWDFSIGENKHCAEFYFEEHQSLLPIGNPLCTILSTLQNLSSWSTREDVGW